MNDPDKNKPASGKGTIGVIMLDTRFPRFVGDIANQDTWPFDVLFHKVSGADAQSVVCATSDQDLQPFIDAGLALQQKGVVGITTSCGFLALLQSEIASHLSVPFLASSLVQLPWVQASLPVGKQVGILTITASALTPAHLLAAGIANDVPVQGCETGEEFTAAILNDAAVMDRGVCERDNVNAAVELKERFPDLGAIVLECTNMAPYANAIHRATGLPVYSIYTLIRWFQSGLAPRQFPN